MALKFVYPGFRKNIANDMANLALLVRLPGLVPAGLDVSALLDRIQAQLEHENEYRAEAHAANSYRALLGEDPVLSVPAVTDEHWTDHIIATELAPGAPVDRLAQPGGGTQAQRDHVASALSRLAVHAFFRMRLATQIEQARQPRRRQAEGWPAGWVRRLQVLSQWVNSPQGVACAWPTD